MIALSHLYTKPARNSTSSTSSTSLSQPPMRTSPPTATSIFGHILLSLVLVSLAISPLANGLHLGGDQAVRSLGHAHPESQTPPLTNSTMDFLLRALDGLDKSLRFFQREYKNINLDSVIGTRIVQASLQVLLERLVRSGLVDSVPDYVISQVRQLRDAAGEVSEVATPYIATGEPWYFKHIGPILAENLFALDYDSRDVPEDALLWRYNRKEAMKESESDDCLAEIFGTKTGKRCEISRQCWGKMTRLGYNRYSLSHQIFYLEIAEMTGCQEEMRWQLALHNQTSVSVLHDTYCSNMLAEANLIVQNGFPSKAQDLFMEQGALCGLLGYREFFTSDWLLTILSWQDKQDGCYRWTGWPRERDENKISDLKIPGQAQPVSSRRERYKREERRVSRDCLCHRTAVAASVLAQYVRYVLEVWLQEQLS